MINVIFRLGDVVGTATFDADRSLVSPEGRLNVIKNATSKFSGLIVAQFDKGIWQYVSVPKYEVAVEEKTEESVVRGSQESL